MTKVATIQITAWADKNLDNDWTATAQKPSGLAGVFGIGPTMRDARAALAANIAAIPVVAAQYDQVRIFTVTRKTFNVAELVADNS